MCTKYKARPDGSEVRVVELASGRKVLLPVARDPCDSVTGGLQIHSNGRTALLHGWSSATKPILSGRVVAMAKIPYDVSKAKPQPASAAMRREAVAARPNARKPGRRRRTAAPKPGSFEARVTARRVDLVQLVEKGLPPLEYLPASEKMLVRGKRHLIAAPHKTGKSIGMEAHWVDMALAGATVAILDRENGSDLYARRLADIFEARKLTQKKRNWVRKHLRYYEFPELRPDDAEELVEHFADVDLVVFDAQRMFLSDFGLKESDSDDYAAFMSFAIDPLFRAQVATLILDNTGLNDKKRGRGSSSKGDLNEVLFSMETVDDFDAFREGRIRLKVERSRFGNVGEWSMDLGGGTFGAWEPTEASHDDFYTAVTEVLSDGEPRGQDKLIAATRDLGVRVGTTMARRLLEHYAQDDSKPIKHTAGGYVREGE